MTMYVETSKTTRAHGSQRKMANDVHYPSTVTPASMSFSITSESARSPISPSLVIAFIILSPSCHISTSPNGVPSLSWMSFKIKTYTSTCCEATRLLTHFSTNCHQLCHDQPTRDQPQPAPAGFGKMCVKKCE